MSPADRPVYFTVALGDRTAGDIDLIWVRRERKYFCK